MLAPYTGGSVAYGSNLDWNPGEAVPGLLAEGFQKGDRWAQGDMFTAA